LNQLRPIARFTADPTVLVVRADAPWKTLDEFVADARRYPGRYNYGSSGNYGTMHVPMEMLKASAAFRMTHIPYTGAGPAVVALLAGQVDAIATGPSTIVQQIQAGKLRALAVSSAKRFPLLPDLPTIAESYPAFESLAWNGVLVPAATPKPVVARLNAEIDAILKQPDVVQKLNAAGFELVGGTPEQFAAIIKGESEKWAPIIKSANIKID